MFSKDTKFGVEIECLIPSDLAPRQGGYHNGIQIDGFPSGWNSQRDGSINCNLSGYTGVEIVSPVLKGEKGLTEVVAVFDWLTEIGAKVNKSTGLHVHVDGRSLDMTTIRRLVTRFKILESVFYSVNGETMSDRLENRYCKRSQDWFDDSGLLDRYQSLNLTNWMDTTRSQKRTVEFRLFSGSLDAMHVVSIIHLCVGFVAMVVNGDDENVTDARSLSRIFRGTTYRIVPDAPIYDVMLHTLHQIKKAR